MSNLARKIIKKACVTLSPLTEKLGFSLVPIHYYYPVPDMKELRKRKVWDHRSSLAGIDWNEGGQLAFLEKLSEFGDEPDWKSGSGDPDDGYRVDAASFGYASAILAYTITRYLKPSRVIEIGCGWSTLALLEAAKKNADESGKDWKGYLGFDPYPMSWLPRFTDPYGKLKARKAQDIPLQVFEKLGANDILFIDSTHVLNTGSDVQYLYLEILPRLKQGVVVHIHDIQTPWEYTKEFAEKHRMFWNEQYLLEAFLAHNKDFEILAAGQWLCREKQDEVEKAFSFYNPDEHSPTGSFWMRRKGG